MIDADAGPVRLVVSDVDGTLVNHDKKLSAGVTEAVRDLVGRGVPFTLISARPPSGVLPMVEALGLTGPVAAYNGGTIFRPGGEVIERHAIPAEVTRGMLALVAHEPVSTWVFADGRWHADTLDNPHVPRERISANQEPTITTDMMALAGDAEKLTFVSDDPELLARLTKAGVARFGEQATIAQSQTYYLDVTALAANKGAGVTALAKAYGVALEDTAVFGDMNNDLPMFARAGFAVAMGQASDAVKAAADAVSTSNDEDGVAVAIRRYVLPRLETHA